MSKKRKDKFKNVLQTGERQIDGGRYQYRYTDILGVRHAVYADTLAELRLKEKRIKDDLETGIDYNQGNITLLELVERYLQLKKANRYNTKVGYDTVLGILKKETFSYRRIKDIKTSDAKLWFMNMQKQGKRYCTISNIRGVLKPAFDLAWDEEVIRRNPFAFKITDAIVNDTVHRAAMTEEQQHEWLEFFRTDETYSKYYDIVILLIETGMRVSELCGLTKKDLNFTEKYISVDHQLIRQRKKDENEYYIEKTKTDSGKRRIPMSPAVEQALRNILANRPKVKVERIVTGYSGFILLDKNCNPCVALHIENALRWGRSKYNKLHPDNTLPNVTPHVLRHTFCTNMARQGIDVKALQYLMGHSDASVTMNVYNHAATFDHAVNQLKKLQPSKEKAK